MSDQPPEQPSALRRIVEIPVHPFLFGLYAVVFLWSQNVDKVRTADTIVPLLVVFGGTLVAVLVAWGLYRRIQRAALVVTMLSFLFFSYGHIFGSSTASAQEAAIAPAHQPVWLTGWAVLALAAIALPAVMRVDGRRAAYVLNVVLTVLVALAVITIAVNKLQGRSAAPVAAAPAPSAASTSPPPATSQPTPTGPNRDIYFIILDRYAHQQTLKENYNYDNTYFIEGLEKRGFYVADGSRAPYPKTPHSIQTTLNMEYLDALPDDSSNWQIVYDRLKNPRTAQFLKERGYKYVLMGSGYHSLRSDPAADLNVVYDPSTSVLESEFAQVLYDSTVLAAAAKQYDVGSLDPRRVDYNRALFQYQELPKIAAMRERTFTFAHILVTHPPYVVKRDCSFKTEEELNKQTIEESFVDTVECEGNKTLELIDKLLDVPDDRKPIIVIQGDEGPGPVGWNPNTKAHYDWRKAPADVMYEKFRIFNSYYMPGLEETGLYSNISPVNSFRLIFNKYFDADYALLPDRSYVFIDELHPYVFIDVTDRVKN